MITQGQWAYRQYLRSPHWQKLRHEAFKLYGFKCGKCLSNLRLQPHHHTYRSPWESCTVADLIILCRNCHRAEHGLPPIQPKKRKPRKPKKLNFKKLLKEKIRRDREKKLMLKYAKKMGVKW